MEITWYGQSTFKIKGKGTSIVTDPYSPEMLGLKLPKLEADIVAVSHDHGDHNNVAAVTGYSFVAPGPGEYEIKGIPFIGVDSFHDNSEGSERGRNTIYVFHIDNIAVCHLGDLGQDKLTDDQLNQIDSVDILMIPVGGTYTIDAATAAKVVAQLEPKLIIPMHYQVDGLKLELAPVETFLKEMGKESAERVTKLSISADKLPEEPQVVILEKS